MTELDFKKIKAAATVAEGATTGKQFEAAFNDNFDLIKAAFEQAGNNIPTVKLNGINDLNSFLYNKSNWEPFIEGNNYMINVVVETEGMPSSGILLILPSQNNYSQWLYLNTEIANPATSLDNVTADCCSFVKRDGFAAGDTIEWTEWTYVNKDQNAKEVLIGVGNAITVGNPIGLLTTGTVISDTENLHEVVRKMLATPAALPTLTLSGSGSGNVEIGSNINTSLNPTFSQKDGGAVTAYRLKKDGTILFTDAAPTNHTQTINAIAAVTTYVAEADYSANPAKGVAAGKATSGSVTFTPQRRAFAGKINIAPTVSADIRALTAGALNIAAGATMKVDVQAGDKGVCFAYPATVKAATSIVQDAAVPMLGAFTETTINVEGADNYAATSYRVYYLIPEFPFTDNASFVLTI
jgi:hypothetical protein